MERTRLPVDCCWLRCRRPARLMLAVPPGYVSAIFPPPGIAIAAMLTRGSATLPCTFVGSLLLNVWIGRSINHQFDNIGLAAALITATATTLQAAIGGWARRRVIGTPAALDRSDDLLRSCCCPQSFAWLARASHYAGVGCWWRSFDGHGALRTVSAPRGVCKGGRDRRLPRVAPSRPSWQLGISSPRIGGGRGLIGWSAYAVARRR
jgi:hypothetical protein